MHVIPITFNPGLFFQHLCGGGRKCSCRKNEFLSFGTEFWNFLNKFEFGDRVLKFFIKMFPSGGTFDSLKCGQNEAVKDEAEDFKSAIEFYESNIVYYDSFGVCKINLAKSLHRNGSCASESR